MTSPEMKAPVHWHQLKINDHVVTDKSEIVGAASLPPLIDTLNDIGAGLTDAFLRPYASVFDEGSLFENFENPSDDLFYLPPYYY